MREKSGKGFLLAGLGCFGLKSGGPDFRIFFNCCFYGIDQSQNKEVLICLMREIFLIRKCN